MRVIGILSKTRDLPGRLLSIDIDDMLDRGWMLTRRGLVLWGNLRLANQRYAIRRNYLRSTWLQEHDYEE